ncbi:hypothetical protein CRM22_010700 [Opisthorchis felineus]|uniref:KIF-binding protein n=1 Tax=Opisthorchis felineus TaxID=147828 RepID=A0A4S2KV56_OPIFE|nr:hypothetical protein CRM22_010700 [Opisthorchis felineus]
MLQVQKFIEDHTQTLKEVRNLEFVRIQQATPAVQIRLATRRKYTELLEAFESSFPKICTAMHFLYWGFIRARIANTYLESSEPAKAYALLKVIFSETKDLVSVQLLADKLQYPERFPDGGQYSNSDLILLDTFAGLFQTVFNLLAASVAPSSDDSKLERKAAETSFHWLQCAKRVHELYVEHNNRFVGPTFWETIAFKDYVHQLGDTPEKAIRETRQTPERLLFEHGYTNTIFLLAQAYQLANEPSHAATCCQLTLSRQLTYAQPFKDLAHLVLSADNNRTKPRAASARRYRDANQAVFGNMRRRFACYVSNAVQPFDPIDWANNAASLSNYYESVEESDGYYYSTLECLVSACAIIDQVDVRIPVGVSTARPCGHPKKRSTELYLRTRANVYRALGQFGLNLLQRGSECIKENPKLLYRKRDVAFSDQAKDFGSMFQLSLRSFLRQLVESDLSEARSSSLSADTDNTEDSRSPAPPTSVEAYVDMLATCPTTYESAIPVFRMISHCFNQAEQYYTISEHCSDAVALGQQRSKAYLLMSGFESSEARQCRMHKRRVDVLETILRPLSRKHYLMLCRQLMFELAEALSTMRDLKQRAYEEVRQAKTESALHYARKANSLAKRALAFYQQLINSYARPNQLCHTLSEDEIRPLMLAHFYSARLHSKLFPATREDRVQNLSKALSQYNYVVSLVEAHLRHNPESTIGQSEEVQIARDMAHLLPTKITRLHRGERLAD